MYEEGKSLKAEWFDFCIFYFLCLHLVWLILSRSCQSYGRLRVRGKAVRRLQQSWACSLLQSQEPAMGIPWAQPLPSSSSATGKWNLLCRVAWGFIPFCTIKSMIQCLRTGKMNKLHRHGMESIRKWVVTGIRKSTNEKGNAVTNRRGWGEARKAEWDFAIKATCRHTYKEMRTRQTKEVWEVKGGKRENSEQNIIIAEHFQILRRKIYALN